MKNIALAYLLGYCLARVMSGCATDKSLAEWVGSLAALLSAAILAWH